MWWLTLYQVLGLSQIISCSVIPILQLRENFMFNLWSSIPKLLTELHKISIGLETPNFRLSHVLASKRGRWEGVGEMKEGKVPAKIQLMLVEALWKLFPPYQMLTQTSYPDTRFDHPAFRGAARGATRTSDFWDPTASQIFLYSRPELGNPPHFPQPPNAKGPWHV